MAKLSATLLASTAKVGNTVFIGVYLDTEGEEVTGVDVFLSVSSRLERINIHFMDLLGDPVEVFHFSPTITFSDRIVLGQPNFKGKGLIAVIECAAMSKGYANIRFQYAAGGTTDSNVASVDGKDLLTAVTNRRLTIT